MKIPNSDELSQLAMILIEKQCKETTTPDELYDLYIDIYEKLRTRYSEDSSSSFKKFYGKA